MITLSILLRKLWALTATAASPVGTVDDEDVAPAASPILLTPEAPGPPPPMRLPTAEARPERMPPPPEEEEVAEVAGMATVEEDTGMVTTLWELASDY